MGSVLEVLPEEGVPSKFKSKMLCGAPIKTANNPNYKGPVGLFINNEFVPSVSGKKFQTVNPANEKVLAELYEADAADVDVAVKAARTAFKGWKEMDGSKRRDMMLKLADLLEQNQDEFALWESLDNGKPVHIAKAADIALSIKCYRYYAGWADKGQGKTIPIDGEYFCYTRHEPVGVCGQIIPWNFPLLMQAWKLGPALAMGCTVVMKTSEKTPITGLMFCKLIKEAGFPAGVVNVLSGYGPTAGAAISSHPDINKVAFTGSTKVGKIVSAAAASSNLKRVTLELGGKSAFIIMDDADIDQAIQASQLGLFFNSGQCCIAGSRVFVHEAIYDEFVKRSVEACRKQVTGDPNSKDTFLGPVVDKIQYNSVMSYIEAGKQSKARLACGGGRLGSVGYYVEPTVFADVTDDMKIAKEEIFGPVMSILKFKTIDEVVERANSSNYGLGAGVCTRDIGKAIKLSNQLDAGTVYVNCYDVFDAAAPFGGFKQSGMGRELGEYGLKNYTEVKTVIVAIDK